MITLLGLLAGGFTTFSLIPQLFQVLKTKQTKDLSLRTYIILCIGVFLWLMYGLFMKDLAVIIANAFTFLLSGSIVLLKIKHG